MNFRILTSLAPVFVFLGLERLGLPPAVTISGGFLTSTIVYWMNRRDRLIGTLTLFGFLVVAVSAVVGIVSSSEKAYLAAGPISDLLLVPLYVGSIVLRQPLVGGIARELVPAIAWRLPVNAPVFIWLSWTWAAYNLLQGAVRWYMLQTLSVIEFSIWSRVIGIPISGALFLTSGYLIYRASRRHAREHRLEAEPLPAS